MLPDVQPLSENTFNDVEHTLVDGENNLLFLRK
jgi:hypothetical protein